MKKTMLLVLFWIGCSTSFAGESTSYVSGYTCGQYVQTDERTRHQYGLLVVGYVSAANQLRGRLTRQTKTQDLLLWVSEYCKNNALDNLADALFSLDMALEAQHGTK